MNWILVLWIAFTPAKVSETWTYEECAYIARQHVENRNSINPRAFCIKRDGTAVVQVEPDRARPPK